ncbi:MAG: hypothetical protein H6R25_3579 [Proteobacteria bacterium]|nr:hypothetical protein [Pseudomonadota bacterium]
MLAGLPLGMPGIGLVMDGAVQHAPQSGRHCIMALFFDGVPGWRVQGANYHFLQPEGKNQIPLAWNPPRE